jgi:hypothetical protein
MWHLDFEKRHQIEEELFGKRKGTRRKREEDN